MKQMQAPFAQSPDGSRGRQFPENNSRHRTCFQRDRDRIIHSSAFRRLKHKTQVFVEHEGDYYRTRLTHTLEVAQVARTLAVALGLNQDLAEAVALAHDLGHTPFGHTGEDTLDALMADYGGFDHNAQAVRIVTHLERHYADFDGLNLTWETLEGMAKHNGPVTGQVPGYLAEFSRQYDLELTTFASAEAQVAALADDIAYNNHDVLDGLRAGILDDAEVAELPRIKDAFAAVDAKYPGLDRTRRRHEALRAVFGAMVEDVLAMAHTQIQAMNIQTVDDVRGADGALIKFSSSLEADIAAIREFLFARMYRAPSVVQQRAKAAQVMRDLFAIYMKTPSKLPQDWWGYDESRDVPRRVADYIAGMTDRFALKTHEDLTR